METYTEPNVMAMIGRLATQRKKMQKKLEEQKSIASMHHLKHEENMKKLSNEVQDLRAALQNVSETATKAEQEEEFMAGAYSTLVLSYANRGHQVNQFKYKVKAVEDMLEKERSRHMQEVALLTSKLEENSTMLNKKLHERLCPVCLNNEDAKDISEAVWLTSCGHWIACTGCIETVLAGEWKEKCMICMNKLKRGTITLAFGNVNVKVKGGTGTEVPISL